MKKIAIFGCLVVASSALVTACSAYRVVKRTQTGGEVALEGDREGAMEKARAYMASQCPSGFDVVEEGEAVVGQDIQTTTKPTTTLFGGPAQTTHGSATDKREWRVRYQCKGTTTVTTTPPPAGAPAPAPLPSPSATGAQPPAPAPTTPGPGGAQIKTLIVRF